MRLLWMLCLLTVQQQINAQVWESPYFLKPDDMTVGNIEFQEDIANRRVAIKIDEELEEAITIAKLTYTGAEVPTLTYNLGNDAFLGLTVTRPGVGQQWLLVVTKKQDSESSISAFNINVVITGEAPGNLLLSITNINDNLPYFEMASADCKVPEDFGINLATSCEYIVRDLDGILEDFVTFEVDSPVAGQFKLQKVGVVTNGIRTAIFLNTKVDYEAINLHMLTLRAIDNAYGTQQVGTTVVILSVIDVQDTPPRWAKSPLPTWDVPEELESRMNFIAQDGDTGNPREISYELVSGDVTVFSVVANNGGGSDLVIKAVDRDTFANNPGELLSFDVVVRAFETEEPTEEIRQEISVLVSDRNDNIPAIDPNTPLTASVDEGEAVSLVFDGVDKVTVKDPDLGSAGQFSITLEDVEVGSEWSKVFMVVPSSGYQETEVTVSVRDATKIDFEALGGNDIQLLLKATERLDPSKSSTVTITVVVNDLKDETPKFEEDSYEQLVLENAKINDPVVTVKAIDADAGDVITYRIATTTSAFKIDAATGAITIAIDRALNYEQQREYTLQVEAKDLGGLVDFVEVKVIVGDVNDVTPTLEGSGSTDISVEEHKDVGTEITRAIKGVDPDTTAKLVISIDWTQSFATQRGVRVADATIYENCVSLVTEYEVSGVTGEATGVLTVEDKVKLDWEKFDILYLMIVVEDVETEENERTRQGLQAVNILNIPDNPPVFNEDTVSAAKTVVENTRAGQLIGYVVASDPDLLQPIKYSIAPKTDSPAEWITIDEVKGELRTAATLQDPIDVESLGGTELFYIITADDGTQTSTREIKITVVDQNDETPTFGAVPSPILIPENSASGTPVTTLTASDADFSPSYKELYFELDPRGSTFPKVENLLSVDSGTGVVTVELKNGAILDREAEANGEITVYLIVRDNPNPPSESFTNQLSASTIFVLKLSDENDEKPIFQPANIPGILESVDANVLVYSGIYAPDKDEGINAQVSYRITEIKTGSGPVVNPPQDMFKLVVNAEDPNKADIMTGIALTNYYGGFVVTIEAKDGGVGAVPVLQDFIITVIDVNDNDPIFVFPTDMSSIRLKIDQVVGGDLVLDPLGENLQLFEATDADDNDNGRVTFEILGDATAIEYFEIRPSLEPNKARLLLMKVFAAQMPVFNLVVEARDNGNPVRSVQSSVRMYVVDRSDLKPFFNQTQPDLNWEEGDPNHKQLLPPAYDPNNPGRPEEDYEKIFYYLVGTGGEEGDPSFFSVDSITNELTLMSELDREAFHEHNLIVVAANVETVPTQWELEQELKVKVVVGDIADSDPTFDNPLYVGGISPSESSGYEVLKIKATDLDDPSVDSLTYDIQAGSMQASEDYLVAVMNNAFEVQSVDNEAIIKTTFAPEAYMEGFFTFILDVTDSTNRKASTEVKIYIISSSNRVFFLFINEQSYVEEKRSYITDVFTKHLGYDCSVDGVSAVNDPTSGNVENRTQVRTHFINTELNLPVPGAEIESKATNYDTLLLMQTDLRLENLELIDVLTTAKEVEDNLAAILTVVLIVVSVVLGALVIILFVGFVLKTRSLNRRLKALTTTRFGSQESGMNRIGMHAPNTNKHAIEGSNPVWNEDIPTYDNQSQGSGDSELIGVEDRPEFGYGKDGNLRNSQEGGYYSGSDIAAAAAAAAAAQDQHIASTEL